MPDDKTEREFGLLDYLSVLRRRKLLIFGLAFAVGAGALLFSFLQTPV